MIQAHPFLFPVFDGQEPKELVLLSVIAQSLFQPFAMEDNLTVILTALTSGSGIGFNRAMLLRVEGTELRGTAWLGPRSAAEARIIWDVLSTPGIGYVEIIEHNRALLSGERDSLSSRVRPAAFPLRSDPPRLPGMAAGGREALHVVEARNDPRIDPAFQALLDVDEFLCIPLFTQQDPLGVIIVDNAYTGRRIERKDIQLASLCGLIAANHMSGTLLHRRMVEMEKMAVLGEMASFLTHQLRNPLAAIGGFATQLLNGGPLDEAKARRNLEIIRRETKRLEDVLTEVGQFMTSGLLRPAAFDLAAEVAAVIDSPGIRMKAEGRTLRLDPAAGDLPAAYGDATTAGEAVKNLITNALEAVPAGGRVVVRLRRGAISGVAVEVEDDGSGIPPEAKARLFQPFFTTKDKGLGLGLPFVKRVMDVCGGRAEVESGPGRGATFRLTFPEPPEGRTDA